MYFEIPEKIQKLVDIFDAYLDNHADLVADAPDYVKKAYDDFQYEWGLLTDGVM